MNEREPDSVTRCNVCAHGALTPILTIPDVPVHCNVLWSSSEQARGAPTGDITLAMCPACGHVLNTVFEPSRVEYSPAYENSLHFSPRFQQYAEELAERLIARYDLHGKVILEIGSGKGEFLRLLAELGDNRGIGFDPSYGPADGPEQPGASGLTFVRDVYSERYGHYRADLVCCRQVLEHIASPTEFLSLVRRTIGERRDAAVFFEVPNGLYTLRDLAIWDIIYEHCSYFTLPSLVLAFELAGFRVDGVGEAFERQYLWLDASPQTGEEHVISPTRAPSSLKGYGTAFAARYRERLHDWQGKLEHLARRGDRAAVWGAGSKGVTFLNAVDARQSIAYVVDVNPRKQGMFVPGTGQRIVPPASLCASPPDVVIVMNPNYEGEIRQQLQAMGVSARVLLA